MNLRFNRGRLFAAAGGILFAVALLLGLLWAPIQRAFYEAGFDAATGARLTIGALQRDGASTTLTNVTVKTPDGSALFAIRRIRITRTGARARVAVEAPAGTVELGHDTLHQLKRLLRGVAFASGTSNVAASIVDGSLRIARSGSAAAPVQIDGFAGSIETKDGVPAIDGSAQAASDGVQSALTVSGGHAHVAQLALASLAALLPPSSLTITGGTAHDLDVTWTNGLSGSIGISGARGSYAQHAFRGMHGTVLVAADGLATRTLAGLADEIPLTISGELHDVRSWNAALRTGTPALRSLARAYEMIAPTQHLHYIKLETTAPGVTYAQYAMVLDDLPRVVQFVTIDPHEKTLHFDTALSGNHLISSGERTSDMGIRTHAVAGLNGDYFDIGATYQPQGMLIKGGRIFRGPVNREALIIDRDNNVYFSEFHLQGSVTIGTRTLAVTQYNDWPLGLVTIVTPDFGRTLPAENGVRFLSLRYVRADMYRVTGITRDALPSPIAFGVAIGPDVKDLTLPHLGDIVRLHYGIAPFVKHAVAGIGGGPLLLRNGQWFEDPDAPAPDERDVRWPVDALGIMSDRSLIMVAVDGRHPDRSVGMTRPEFGKLLQDLGVTDAMALDSGGSVTLVARSPGERDVSLHNVPSDDSAERYVSNALFLYSSAPAGSLLQNGTTASASLSN